MCVLADVKSRSKERPRWCCRNAQLLFFAICSSPGVGESSAKGVYLWDTERKAWGREV